MKRGGMVVNAKNFKCGRKMVRAAIRDGNAYVRRCAKRMSHEEVERLGLVVNEKAGGAYPHLGPYVVRGISVKQVPTFDNAMLRRIVRTYRERFL